MRTNKDHITSPWVWLDIFQTSEEATAAALLCTKVTKGVMPTEVTITHTDFPHNGIREAVYTIQGLNRLQGSGYLHREAGEEVTRVLPVFKKLVDEMTGRN
ncbi:MAG: hypothetical protein JWN37_475 [Candidatus Nomurabacteria bacterium]|nr:hypothetical protein [Candidatus Nomurabacteria bacterium]